MGPLGNVSLREALDVTAPVADTLEPVIDAGAGLVLVTGPTGVGKTALAVGLLGARHRLGLEATFHGDLATAGAARGALLDARTRFVVAILRTGESRAVFARLRELLDTPLPAIALTVVTMRLLPRLCASCRRAASFRSGPPIVSYRRGEGCDECTAGYTGTVRVVEVLRYDAGKRFCRSASGDLATDGMLRLIEGSVASDDLATFIPRGGELASAS
jgi:type II secretory ATPase GspE/PulE/Tfp pilus assembly ATPase PilB-like protein